MSDPKKFPFQPKQVKPDSQAGEQTDYHDMNTIRVPAKPRIQDKAEADLSKKQKNKRPDSQYDDATKQIPRIPPMKSSPNMTPLPDDMEDPEGSFRIGPYLVYEELAKGGMGAVYDAVDPVLNRRVAIKIMDAKLVHDQDAVKRFQREARATASIDHENVARIYMVGMTEDGAPFIAMEFIDGGTIEDLVHQRDKVTYSQVTDLMIQSCKGLEAAQKEKIIHRDIKPANIMLTKNYQVKVVDFGLAKFFQEETYRTMAGMVMGTPRYMSPEQAQGREVDHRSDIYSLGATMYHLLSGRSPFDGENPTQIMMKQVSAPLISMRNHNPDIPLEFEEFVIKCLQKEREKRFQDYTEMITDLSRLKLQFRSREEGSFVDQQSLIPSQGLDTRGHPLPPSNTIANYSSGSPSRSSGFTQTEAQEEQSEEVPIWRWVAIGGAAFFVLIIVLTLVMKIATGGGDESVQANNTSSSDKPGLQVLLEAIIKSQNGGADEEVQRIDPDYVAWLATETILYSLQEGVEDYNNQKGEYPSKLRNIVREEVIFQNFDIDTDDTPLDAWGSPFEYLPASKTLVSAGLDQRHFTEDDLVLEMDDVVEIRGESGQLKYDGLLEAEGKRQEFIEGSS